MARMPVSITPAVVTDGKNVVSDSNIVNPSTEALLGVISAYMIENKIRFIDAFMIMHNLHKIMISAIAQDWEPQGIPKEKVFRMADMTFRKAMREMRWS